MKKTFNTILAALSVLFLAIACNKEIPHTPGDTPEEGIPVAAETVTVTATLSDVLTRVSFDPVYDNSSKPTGMSHTWEAGDQLRVYDAADHSVYEDYLLDPACAGLATGTFTGNALTASSYDVEAIPVGGPFADGNTQIQASDGDTAHLKFVAAATGVTDLTDIQLTETSGIIGIIAKLPAGAAAGIDELEIQTSADDFGTSTTLTVQISTAGDTDNDDILKVYANVPDNWAISAGTKMFLRFKAPNTSHTVYTRYQEFATAVTPQEGKFNYIKMNCVNTDRWAGGADAGTQAAPYLIADPYQLAAVNGLAATGSTTYFKMIDNVDMTDVTHNPINTADGYTQVVNFDGNHKTISNLAVNLFYVFKGSINDLTLDNCNVGAKRGIFAEYCQGTGHTITNVNILNGSVSSGENVGSLIGRINSGTTGMTTVTITDCEVSGTNVTGSKTVGGVIGFAEAMVDVSGCKYTGGTVTCSGQYVGGFVGSTGNVNSTFTNCQVESATINANHTEDARGGGFVGQLQDKVTISGCTVGSSSEKVVINTKQPTNSKVINVGGFVGVCYGTITKNGDVRSNAYVKITSNNTLGTPLKLGGFVGFHSGNIEYCDAIVDMTSLKGQHIGGFAGYVIKGNAVRAGRIDNCTVSGQVTGNNYTGGFW